MQLEETLSMPDKEWRPEAHRRSSDEITQPLRILCSRQPLGPLDRLARWFKRKETEAQRTLHWTEIGGKPPAA